MSNVAFRTSCNAYITVLPHAEDGGHCTPPCSRLSLTPRQSIMHYHTDTQQRYRPKGDGASLDSKVRACVRVCVGVLACSRVYVCVAGERFNITLQQQQVAFLRCF